MRRGGRPGDIPSFPEGEGAIQSVPLSRVCAYETFRDGWLIVTARGTSRAFFDFLYSQMLCVFVRFLGTTFQKTQSALR